MIILVQTNLLGCRNCCKAPLFWSIHYAPTIIRNIQKFVIVVTFYIMHKRKKRTSIPLKPYKSSMIIYRRKGFFECRISLRFYFRLLVLLLDWLLVLLHVSLVLTLVDGTVCYRFLGFFFIVCSCMQTILALFKSKIRFIQWWSLDLKQTIQGHDALLHISLLSQGHHFSFQSFTLIFLLFVLLSHAFLISFWFWQLNL